MTDDYPTFLARKAQVPPASGFDISLNDLHPRLFDWQARVDQWALKRGRAALFCDTGLGKCHGKGTPILMHDGSIKAVEDVRVRDLVMGPDSKPRRVLSLTQGVGELYRIIPVKGDPWVCNEDHVLSLKITCDHKKWRKDEVINISVRDYLAWQSSDFKHVAKLWRTGVDFPSQDAPFPAYSIGLWLGDGTKRSQQITNPDPEITEYLTGFASSVGLSMAVRGKKDSPAKDHYISTGMKGKGNAFRTYLKTICVQNDEKRIPREYLINDRNTRLSMLAGLLDTDGYHIDGCYEIITEYAGLRDDILFLARSLGLAATWRVKIGTIKSLNFSREYFRIFISGNTHDIPCLLPRKQAKPRQQIKSVLKTGFTIEPLGAGAYYGFEVSGDHLYLLGDFTVTHNSGLSLEWMAGVAEHTNEQVLLVTPLAVAHQFVRDEAPALDLQIVYCRSQAEADAARCPLIVTNYDMVQHFDPSRYAGIALDEADVLANFTGKRKNLLMAMFQATPYKLAATATPAPNDLIELGNYAEFLGVMTSGEMLTRYFLRDSNDANNLRLRHWANSGPFWDWLVQWAVCIGLPSDYGEYSDDGYILPPLDIQQHTVQVDYSRAWGQGKLWPDAKQSATDLWATKRETHVERCELAAEIVSHKPDVPWVVWCSTDDESRLLTKLIPDAVEVRGSHTPAEKEKRLRAFSEGRARIIISKTEICGQGLNWQHCADMVFCSPTFSFKRFYQGLRRIWRFRQEKPVTCHVIIAETEESVLAAVERKQEQHKAMHAKARAAMKRQATLTSDASEAHEQVVRLPTWLNVPVEEEVVAA